MINVLIFQGLWGSYFSRFEGLEEKLRKLPNVDYIEYVAYTDTDRITKKIAKFKDKTIPICHSFGVGAFLQVSKALPNIEFPLVFTVDPSQYWWTSHDLTPNIKQCINFWQDAPLWFIGNQQIAGAENIHIDTSHARIDDHPTVHKRIIKELTNVG